MSSWTSFSSAIKQKKDSSVRPPSLTRKELESNVGASSSFLGLKAELADRKGSSKKEPTSKEYDFLTKKEKKLPAHLQPSPDVLARSRKHDQRQTTSAWANTPSSQLDAARVALERKAALYDKLKRGATGGLDEQALQESLIDWDRKGFDRDEMESNSSSEDEDSGGDTVSNKGKDQATDSEEDPMTEYEDDLGRMRRVRRSKMPRSALRNKQEESEEHFDDNLTIYGPSTSFPVFKMDPATRYAEDKGEGYKRKGVDHFDAQFEKRYRGAGFYQFSQDEETRKKEMKAIREDRDETERMRGSLHADDKAQSIAERKREERRKLIESKRREIDEKRRRLCRKEAG